MLIFWEMVLFSEVKFTLWSFDSSKGFLSVEQVTIKQIYKLIKIKQ